MNTYRFMRNNAEDCYGLFPLQEKISEIIFYIDGFCKEHGITYYLMGGSALGAVRHGGFIPWDDDLDIFMPYPDYMRFISCCKQHLDTTRFYFQEEDTVEQPHFFCKLRMNGTLFVEPGNANRKMHEGIFVDIMCLNNAPACRLGQKIQYYAAGMLKARACTKTVYTTDSKTKKLQLLVAKILVNGPIKQLLMRIVRRYNKTSTPFSAHLFGRAKFSNSFYPADIFGAPRYVPFEQIELPVPTKVEEYLALRFGPNYMEMPSAETRKAFGSHNTNWKVSCVL